MCLPVYWSVYLTVDMLILACLSLSLLYEFVSISLYLLLSLCLNPSILEITFLSGFTPIYSHTQHISLQTHSPKYHLFSHLVEDDGHDEEVQQEALGGVRTVEVEKDEREEQGEELEAGVAEGRTQKFQPGDCRQENI